MIKEKISILLSRYGLLEKSWWLLFKLHLDATSRRGGINADNMILTRDFFKKNDERIENVISKLNDNISREIYRNQIEYRKTYNRKHLKPYNINNQYLPNDIIKLDENEIFVDCGAFVGDTCKKIKKISHNHYKQIVCFEPDTDNYKRLKKRTSKDKRIIVYNKGCWNKSEVLKFSNSFSSSSKIVDESNNVTEIKVCALDSISECKNASFIKMDIEGSEYNALLGAKEIIKRNRPILAICIYHSDEDMLRIPELIMSQCDKYNFFVRQHSFLPLETVFYAVPCERSI